MNTNLINQVNPLIADLHEWAKQGMEFTKEQAPLVVQEFLNWSFWSDAILAVVSFVLMVVLIYLLKRFWNSIEDELGAGLFQIFGIIISVVFCCLFISCIHDLVKIKLAPRVYLIEWVADQMKKG